jgi:hypothetical protein
LSDTCYELFDANIEGAHAFSRKILIDIAVARFDSNRAFILLLFDIRQNFKIMNRLLEQALSAEPRKIPTKHKPSIKEQKRALEDGVRLLKETAKDNLKIKQKMLALARRMFLGNVLFSIILERLSAKLFENIEDLCLIVEAALEEEGEYITAEEILRSLS